MSIEGNVRTVYVGDTYEYSTQVTGVAPQNVAPLGLGIQCQDNATGTGYLMFSYEDVTQRFSAHPPNSSNARHFVCVKYTSGQWYYDNDTAYYAFTPAPSDILMAAVNFTADTVTSLLGTNTTEYGIAKGYASGNLAYTADWYNDVSDDGEFSVGGTSFTPNTLVIAKKYYYAGGQRVAMRVNGTLSYILGDHLGSTNITTDRSGTTKTSETLYKPWGEVRFSWGTSPTDYSYTGQYSYMEDFGLMFYGARWYDPALGRFAQADSIVPGGSPTAFDRYAYVLNSPMMYTDKSGSFPIPTTCIEDQCSPYFIWIILDVNISANLLDDKGNPTGQLGAPTTLYTGYNGLCGALVTAALTRTPNQTANDLIQLWNELNLKTNWLAGEALADLFIKQGWEAKYEDETGNDFAFAGNEETRLEILTDAISSGWIPIVVVWSTHNGRLRLIENKGQTIHKIDGKYVEASEHWVFVLGFEEKNDVFSVIIYNPGGFPGTDQVVYSVSWDYFYSNTTIEHEVVEGKSAWSTTYYILVRPPGGFKPRFYQWPIPN